MRLIYVYELWQGFFESLPKNEILYKPSSQMDKLIIHGGKRLKGSVKIGGAKNAALPCLAATILAEGRHTLHNIPQVADVRTMVKLLQHIGVVAEFTLPNNVVPTLRSGISNPPDLKVGTTEKTTEENVACFATTNLKNPEAPYDIVKTMRASSLVLGPMLARFGRARVSLPGGCAIGARPLNLHLKALESMGAKITIDGGYIESHASRLHGANIHFDNVTVTGTENIMMAAVLANGTTVLENCAREPEVADLGNYLTKMGAHIEGAGTDKITIEGVKSLHPAEHSIIPDRIVAGTFACAAAITGGNITIEDCPSELFDALLTKLQDAGCTIQPATRNPITHSTNIQAPHRLNAVDITTSPFPGFATDLQAQFMACMTLANGTSVITETIFENRFMHVQELIRLGADIKVEGHTAIVKGVPKLTGAPVMATDLRASASLVIAALATEGTTEIQRIYHLDRGYEQIEKKLIELGAEIERVT